MIFLFEQVAYKLSFLEGVLPQKEKDVGWDLPKGFVQKESNGLCKLDGVGYLYNAKSEFAKKSKNSSDKIVFVLPKVFLDENGAKAFGQDVLDGDNFAPKDVPTDFLANLSMWVCSSIGQYRQENPADNDVDVPDAPNATHFSSNKQVPTLIDVMNAMKLFYAENKNLIVFTAKNKHSGNNRIDWRRTVARTQPFMQGDTPIYMELENKKKVFDLDDRLLVLYSSAMNYIEETFGFKMPRSEFYAPMRTNEFRRLLGHRGLMELRRIKHKYFADKFLKLYNIVKAFFEWGGNFSVNDFESEYLLTSKYNNVFEAMIDKLVGDDLPGKMRYLKDQKDGKIIDHLYKDRQLIFADEEQKIWFIGDSKYYKDGNRIEGGSIYKQYTYAKNIIQYNIDELLGDGKKFQGMRYRDDLTEGYSVTPNFFIRGFLPPREKDTAQFDEPYFRSQPASGNNDLIVNTENKTKYNLVDSNGNVIENGKTLWDIRNRHFSNRLFDRDTLLLQVYDVNFLYALKAYTSKRSTLREEFKRDARRKFRNNFLTLLNENYDFYAVWPNGWENSDSVEGFVRKHFRTLVGKIFQPKEFKCLILALEKKPKRDNRDNGIVKENEAVWRKVRVDCEMIARITPKEIWEEIPDNLPEANLGKPTYDKKRGGFFVERERFEKAKIGEKHRLPDRIKDKMLAGYAVAGSSVTFADKDDYYFLPCKAT